MVIVGWFVILIVSINFSLGLIGIIYFWLNIGGKFRVVEIIYLSIVLILNIGLWYWVVVDFPFNIIIK